MHAINIRNLKKDYSFTKALDGLDLVVKEKSIHGFLGPNGAGKSTTINILSGLVPKTSGEIEICGLSLKDFHQQKMKRMGILPEHPPLYENMTLRDYLIFVGEIHSLKRKDSKEHTEKMIKMFHLESVAHRLIGNLSKGYRQRCAIASSMVFDAGILILDEPFVGLDPQSILEMRDIISKLKGEKTILFSTHQLHDVSKICDDITIVANGKTVMSGKQSELSEKISSQILYKVKVKTFDEEIKKECLQLEGVNTIQYLERDGLFHLDITANLNFDPSGLSLILSRFQLVSMERKEIELEDIFREAISL